jgi:pimeloyl-ACP methyl ester carboxylesterase
VISYPGNVPLGYEELEMRVRAALPGSPFVLLAESFSGPIAIRIAADPPADLVALVLCGTFAKNPYPLLGWARPLAAWLPLKSLPRWIRSPLMWGSMTASRAPVQAERAISGVSGQVVRRRVAALLGVDATAALERVRLPVLVLYAPGDRIVPFSATRLMVSHLPAAKVVAVEGPHLLLQTRAAPCAVEVAAFVRALTTRDA